MTVRLTEKNFIMMALKTYENPACNDMDEFQEDLTRTKYIKRLFRKYKTSGDLKERLLLNHIIIFYNVFGIEAATNILFFKIEKEFWPLLKTFLVFLDLFPENDIEKIKIPLEQEVINVLRNI